MLYEVCFKRVVYSCQISRSFNWNWGFYWLKKKCFANKTPANIKITINTGKKLLLATENPIPNGKINTVVNSIGMRKIKANASNNINTINKVMYQFPVMLFNPHIPAPIVSLVFIK